MGSTFGGDGVGAGGALEASASSKEASSRDLLRDGLEGAVKLKLEDACAGLLVRTVLGFEKLLKLDGESSMDCGN
jgi:hypothetical protein